MHLDSARMCRLLGVFSELRAPVVFTRALSVMCMLFSISTDHETILQISGRWALFWLVTAVRVLVAYWPVRGSGDMRGLAVVFIGSFGDL